MIATAIKLKIATNAHSGTIRSVAFLPDGKTIVSGSDDRTIKAWKAGAIPLRITSLRPRLTCPAFSGRYAGAGEREGQRTQQGSRVRPVLAEWGFDCLWVVGPDDQSLGFGPLVSQRSFAVQSCHPAICCAAVVAEQIQHEVP